MVDNNFSCVKEVTKTVHLSLPALYITNELTGVTDILESWKRQYIQQLEGVVVSYKNVSLVSNSGFIVIDKPFVHYNVSATFELFCPSVGSIVKGKINRVNYDYIGCLVHNTINVAIELSENTSDELVNFIAVDRMILFKITCFDFHRRTIRVKGEITDKCISLMKELPVFNTQNDVFRSSQSTFYSTSELSEDATSCGVSKEIDANDASFEDSDNQSQSLLAPNVSFRNIKSGVFNVDHLADKVSSGPPSTSHDSDSSTLHSDHIEEKKPKKHHQQKKSKKDIQITNPEELMEVEDSMLHFNLPTQKKKHRHKKPKDKSSKKTESTRTEKKKKTKNIESVENNDILSSTVSDIDTKNAKTSPKKKKSRKKFTKQNKLQNDSNIPAFPLPQQNDLHESIANLLIKEVQTDAGCHTASPKKKKPKSSNTLTKSDMIKLESNDIDSMINALSVFHNKYEDQATSDIINTEKLQISKKGKKRKRESTDNKDCLPEKKKKTDKTLDASPKKSKDKLKKNIKSKKKDKQNSGTVSKKNKKKKSKDKHVKSKKDKLSYKVNLKKNKKGKGKKSKTKKSKSSSKDKTKKGPSVKTEIN